MPLFSSQVTIFHCFISVCQEGLCGVCGSNETYEKVVSKISETLVLFPITDGASVRKSALTETWRTGWLKMPASCTHADESQKQMHSTRREPERCSGWSPGGHFPFSMDRLLTFWLAAGWLCLFIIELCRFLSIWNRHINTEVQVWTVRLSILLRRVALHSHLKNK